MARAEILTVLDAHRVPVRILAEGPRFLDLDVDAFQDELARVWPRLGLTHVVASFLFEGRAGAWSPGAQDCCLPASLSFAVRYVRVDEEAPFGGAQTERDVGAVLATTNPVDLRSPRLLVRAFLL